MIFYRVYDNTLYQVSDKSNIGFSVTDASYIPDEYLEQQEFVVMRTAHGIGDWGILSAMPRLLKLKYPDCKVYIPSEQLLAKLFGNLSYLEGKSFWFKIVKHKKIRIR
jgi:hypothetical protein